jgi:hypothetical protein
MPPKVKARKKWRAGDKFKNPMSNSMVLVGGPTHLKLCRLIREGKLSQAGVPPCPDLKKRGRKVGYRKPPATVDVKIKKVVPKTIKVKIKAPRAQPRKAPFRNEILGGALKRMSAVEIKKSKRRQITAALKTRKPLRKTPPKLLPKPTRRLTVEGRIQRGMSRRYGF